MAIRKFTPEEIALIGRTMMQGASLDDIELFVQTCERTGLDPFARQIMPTSRNSKRGDRFVTTWTWLVTIDGLRKIALDSGAYEGQEGPFWCGADGAWKDVWLDKKPPLAAKVVVHRRGFRTGLVGIAKYDSYVQKTREGNPNQIWGNLGDHMTAKCAEALALRKAFPNEMAGLYTSDEMAQAGYEIPEPPSVPVASTSAQQPTPPTPDNGWDIDAEDEYVLSMDRAYQAFKQAGKTAKYQEFADKWAKNKNADPPHKVLQALADIVVKLETAAKKATTAA